MNKTHFHIATDDTIQNVQDKFSDLYPFLRINFFKGQDKSKKIPARSVTFCPDVKLGQIISNNSDGEFEISDIMTVSELEKRFLEQFGPYVQITRKSGNSWMETNMTNGWT